MNRRVLFTRLALQKVYLIHRRAGQERRQVVPRCSEGRIAEIRRRERKRTRSHTVKFQKDVRRKPPATKTLATCQRLIEARGQ